MRFTASRELMEKLERVKGRLGHQLKDFSYAELLDKLSELAIKECDHWVALALGGATQLDHLRLLCRACKAAAAIKAFGLSHIERAHAANVGG